MVQLFVSKGRLYPRVGAKSLWTVMVPGISRYGGCRVTGESEVLRKLRAEGRAGRGSHGASARTPAQGHPSPGWRRLLCPSGNIISGAYFCQRSPGEPIREACSKLILAQRKFQGPEPRTGWISEPEGTAMALSCSSNVF